MKTMMRIMVFGQLAEITGSSTMSIEKVDDTEALQETLYKLYPSLKQKTFLIAVDKKIINEKSKISNNAEIALLPPFSGG
jgi:molybdopterin converting factor small subunit